MIQIELMKIAGHPDFLQRIRYLQVKAALAVLNGSPDSADELLGQKILNDEEPLEPWAVGALCNATIAAGAHAADGSTIVDDTLEFVVNSLWPAMKV